MQENWRRKEKGNCFFIFILECIFLLTNFFNFQTGVFFFLLTCKFCLFDLICRTAYWTQNLLTSVLIWRQLVRYKRFNRYWCYCYCNVTWFDYLYFLDFFGPFIFSLENRVLPSIDYCWQGLDPFPLAVFPSG